MQKLPTDVLLHLVSDHLQGDLGTLQATSLVCRDVGFFAQRHLFRRVTITITAGKDCRSRKILEALSTVSIELLSSIKELHLINEAMYRYCSKEEATAWRRDLGPLFSRVVQRFVANGTVETLKVDAIFGENGVVNEAQTRALLEELCQSPSLQDLELAELPGELIRLSFPSSLKHLTIRHGSSFPRDSLQGDNNARGRSPCGGRSPVALESLSIYPQYHPDVTQQPIHFFASPANTHSSLATLKHFAVFCFTGDHHPELVKILQLCKASLQSLDLKSTINYRYTDPGYSLDEFPNLRKLWLTIGIVATSFPGDLQSMGQVLTPRHPSKSFQALDSLVIIVASSNWNETFDNNVHPRSFESFGNQLCANGRACYPCLKEVVVCFVRGTGDFVENDILSNSTTWIIDETPSIWDLALRDALRPLEAIGIEVKVKWMGCNRQIWYSRMNDLNSGI
ncbi:hypothetical protein BKA70DRAFT_1256751 [Coprinopsis sp. MPI-PUGE-AT-0042]|nr:hypothetical protein BKA70DRAFT_1256751 [Coprinopsis sp. MPI-PUGE-AT-0042]